MLIFGWRTGLISLLKALLARLPMKSQIHILAEKPISARQSSLDGIVLADVPAGGKRGGLRSLRSNGLRSGIVAVRTAALNW